MASLFSFASTFVKRAFYNDPFTVTEVRIEDYLHYDIVDRSYALIIHSYVNENAQTNYEIVLNKENQTKTAYRFVGDNLKISIVILFFLSFFLSFPL